MAAIRTSKHANALKYVLPLVEQFGESMANGKSMLWNGKPVVIKSSDKNKSIVDKFVELVKKESTFKDAIELSLETTDSKSVSIGSFEKPKAAATGNKGDIAEGIIGAAIAARFINKNKPITVADVKTVLKKVDPKPTKGGKGRVSEIYMDSLNANEDIVDNVKFYLSLANVNMSALLNPNNWSVMLSDIFESAVKYANGNTVIAWSKLLYENNQKNHIEVLSDGLGNQTGTKVDVKVVVDGQPTNINISLKAGDVKQFGQVGGTEFEKQEYLWDTLAKIDVSSLKTKYNKLLSEKKTAEAVDLTYQFAANKMNSLLSNNATKKKFLNDLGNGIKFFALLNEENVTLVQLNAREAKIYNFSGVVEAIAGLNLKCVMKESAGKPKLIIQDAKSKPLLEIRVKQENKPNGQAYIRNYVEKGSLLGELIAIYA